MKNNWQTIWNNRKIDIAKLNDDDEKALILELKKMVGWDFHVNGSQVKFEEFKKEYEYLKHNLKLDTQTGGALNLLFLK